VPVAPPRRPARRLARAIGAVRAALAGPDERLLVECRERAIALLGANLTRHGMRASAPSAEAASRAYTAVFARDAAICALGMVASADASLARRAAIGLDTLARHQAPSGQIAKFVDPAAREADFWYVGCIDATLWWLLWIDAVDRARASLRCASATPRGSSARSRGCTRRSTRASACCSRTRRATGPTSCRAAASCCTRTRSGAR
jgi:glycogen debranching enzyme